LLGFRGRRGRGGKGWGGGGGEGLVTGIAVFFFSFIFGKNKEIHETLVKF